MDFDWKYFDSKMSKLGAINILTLCSNSLMSYSDSDTDTLYRRPLTVETICYRESHELVNVE